MADAVEEVSGGQPRVKRRAVPARRTRKNSVPPASTIARPRAGGGLPRIPVPALGFASAPETDTSVHEFQPVCLPIWREAFLGVDWLKLKTSAVYYGFGVPRGDKAPVVLVPGFLATDVYLVELYLWLRRIGYRPYMSRIGRNADCPNKLVSHLVKTAEKAHKETGRKVHLIGHSLGGVLARIAGSWRSDIIASVTMLGSPIRGIRVHPFLLTVREIVQHKVRLNSVFRPNQLAAQHPSCYTAACACGFACTWRGDFPADVPQLAIYTKADGVVDWEMCVTRDRKVDVEVRGTHCGLVWNPDVYRVVAEKLVSFEKRRRRPAHSSAL